MKSILFAASIALSLSACDAYADGHAGAPAQEAGGILTDASGLSLYTFDKDKKNKSNCYGGCAKNWPPLMAPVKAKASGGFKPIKRRGGTMQWAYKGEPLYTWFKDKAPGDMTGDGVGGVWHLAKP